MLLGFFAIRFSGQGVLTSASRNVLLLWFERRRGLISGVRGVFVSFAFASAPAALALLTSALGWRAALWVLAALVGGALRSWPQSPFGIDPEACGLSVDGDPCSAGNPRSVKRPIVCERLGPRQTYRSRGCATQPPILGLRQRPGPPRLFRHGGDLSYRCPL